MSIAETKSNESKPVKNHVHIHRVMPKYGVWTEEDKLIIQIAIPGITKENIEMKVLPKYFTLRASRESTVYSLDLDLGMKVEPEVSSAKYEEGLLRVELKRYIPLDHAYEVKIE